MEDELGVLERVRAEHITAGGSVVLLLCLYLKIDS